ncbi:MAG TPA: phosphatase PAP2 family protein [Actinomycetota bacterium]|nr:phosphatase PAP2 family protein [Actinomycetota bacterium]
MVLLVVVVLSVAAGLTGFLVVRHWPKADPALSAADAIGAKLRRHRRPRNFLRSRLDPRTATGLVLTLALIGIVLAGALIGLFAWMIRRDLGVVAVDLAVERWAEAHATTLTDAVLEALTHLGDTETVLAVAIAVGAFGLWRWRRLAVPLFVLSVMLGQLLISNTIKVVIDRARPELRPRADFTGTSFPSGHTTAATATYLAVALVLAIGSSPRARAALAAGAVAIGVAVGCTRVLLGVHFFSDALAGLAIGLSWFGLCAVAFGGRLLSFGAPGRAAAAPTEHPPPVSARTPTGGDAEPSAQT